MNRDAMTTEAYNTEVASRLRGLAAMVESCDEKVKIKLSADLKWNASGDRFKTAILPFDQFSNRFTSYTTERLLAILRKADDPNATPLIERLEGLLKGPQ